MNKKASMMETLVKLILILLVMALLIWAVVEIAGWISKKNEVELCRISVLAAETARLGPLDFINSVSCNMAEVSIDEDGMAKKRGSHKEKKGFAGDDLKDDVMRIIADEMRECWYMFGEGTINPFPSSIKAEVYCFVCSDISFSEDLSKRLGKDISSDFFYGWLKDNYITSKEGATYQEYMQFEFAEGVKARAYDLVRKDARAAGKKKIAGLSPDEDYVIVYGFFQPDMFTRADSITMRKMRLINSLKSTGSISKMYLIPTSEIGAIGCTQVPY